MSAGAGQRITGERVMTAAGGFNPTWQRHVAAYGECEALLPPGRVLDLGCGVGHSYELLAPRETVGVDVDAAALAGQARETRVGDMRALPFPDASFDSVLAVQSIEHVPDPERVFAEVVRVLGPDGTAVFVTPNRLTFARPDEIVDPYHYVEYDGGQLRTLCEPWFEQVDVQGLFGSERYLELVTEQRARLDALLAKDPLRLRRLVPRRLRQRLYDRQLARERRDPDPRAAAIVPADFWLVEGTPDEALDLVAICRGPLAQTVAGASAAGLRQGSRRSRNGRSTSS
jgi:SAM-dependent methyltransferase